MDSNTYCHLEAFKNTPWIFMLKKAAIIHCVHPLHSVPLNLSFIITLQLQSLHSPGEGFIWSIFKQPLLGEFWSPDHGKEHGIHPINSCVFVDALSLVINASVCPLQLSV
jgi:hypothetical protein